MLYKQVFRLRYWCYARCSLCVFSPFSCLILFHCFHSMPSRYVQVNPGPGSVFTVPSKQPLNSWGRHYLRVPQRLLSWWCWPAGWTLHQWVYRTHTSIGHNNTFSDSIEVHFFLSHFFVSVIKPTPAAASKLATRATCLASVWSL